MTLMRELVTMVKVMPRELEAWLVWRMEAFSMADQDRRRGVLPRFVLLHEPEEKA